MRTFRRCEPSLAAAVLMIAGTVLLFTSAAIAGSIFDDDYTPPQRAEPVPPNPAPIPPATVLENTSVPPVVRPSATLTPVRANGGDDVRHPVPDRASRAKCRKLFEDLYAAQLKEHTAEARRKLAQLLLTELAKMPEGSTDRFVMLTGVVQAGEEGQSLRLCFNAAKMLAHEYGVDELATKANAAAKIYAGPASATLASVSNVENLLSLADRLLAEDAFSTVAPVESALQHVVNNISNADLKKEVKEQIADEATIRNMHGKIAPLCLKLAQSPDDPAANLAVGSYLCFQRGQWDIGLPLLARSKDAKLGALAATELSHPTEPQDIIKLADGWYDVASKILTSSRLTILQHASGFYQNGLVGLTGLQALTIEKRLAQLPPSRRFHRVDLLDMFDPATSPVNGKWQIRDGALVCDATFVGRAEFAYEPPEEYDYSVSFAAVSAGETFGQLCYDSGHQFVFVIGSNSNTIAAFEQVNGAQGDLNQTAKQKKQWLVNGQHYASLVKVRRLGIESYLDGQLVTKLKTDGSNLGISDHWPLNHKNSVGIVANKVVMSITSAQIIEITGEGKEILP